MRMIYYMLATNAMLARWTNCKSVAYVVHRRSHRRHLRHTIISWLFHFYNALLETYKASIAERKNVIPKKIQHRNWTVTVFFFYVVIAMNCIDQDLHRKLKCSAHLELVHHEFGKDSVCVCVCLCVLHFIFRSVSFHAFATCYFSRDILQLSDFVCIPFCVL